MRIMLMGLPGTDTAELAAVWGKAYSLPVFHLCDLCCQPDGSARKLSQVQQVLTAVLKNQDWILEGNYPALELEKRIKAADSVILYTPGDLRKKMGFKAWMAQRKQRKNMERLFRALEAREDPKIRRIAHPSEDPRPE